MNEQFTVEGRRILEEKTIGGELQQLVENVNGHPVWHCSCGALGCDHVSKIPKSKVYKKREAALVLTRFALMVVLGAIGFYLAIRYRG